MRPMPTNLGVLAERPLQAASSSSSSNLTPEERQEGVGQRSKLQQQQQQQEQQQQKSYRMYHAVPVYTDFNDVDLVSTAPTPDYFPFADEGEIVSPYDAHERDFTFQMDEEEEEGLTWNDENGSRYYQTSRSTVVSGTHQHYEQQQQHEGYATHHEDDSVHVHHEVDSKNSNLFGSNLQVPQIHIPPRFIPNVAWEHHHRATTSFVHERLHRRREQHQHEGDGDMIEVGSSRKRRESPLVSATLEWQRLELHKLEMEGQHLRDMLKDEERSQAMFAEHDGVYLDYSRQRANSKTLRLLQDLAKRQQLEERIQEMVTGKTINFTEKRAVLHTALRADPVEKMSMETMWWRRYTKS
jgi:hypothetical protein